MYFLVKYLKDLIFVNRASSGQMNKTTIIMIFLIFVNREGSGQVNWTMNRINFCYLKR